MRTEQLDADAIFGSTTHPMLRHVAFVDPGVGGTGIALWEKLDPKKPTPPSATKLVRPSPQIKGATWIQRATSVCDQALSWLAWNKPKILVQEFGELWSGSAKSHSAGTRGDLPKLLFLTGAIVGTLRPYFRFHTVLVTPRQWKGQLPKAVVNARIKEQFGMRFNDHVSDAVGMGLAAMGAL